jgi:hypothetical protein
MALIDIGLQQQLFDGRSSSGKAKVWSSMHTPIVASGSLLIKWVIRRRDYGVLYVEWMS